MENRGWDFNLTLSNSIFTEVDEYGRKVTLEAYENCINIFIFLEMGLFFTFDFV